MQKISACFTEIMWNCFILQVYVIPYYGVLWEHTYILDTHIIYDLLCILYNIVYTYMIVYTYCIYIIMCVLCMIILNITLHIKYYISYRIHMLVRLLYMVCIYIYILYMLDHVGLYFILYKIPVDTINSATERAYIPRARSSPDCSCLKLVSLAERLSRPGYFFRPGAEGGPGGPNHGVIFQAGFPVDPCRIPKTKSCWMAGCSWKYPVELEGWV